MASGIGHILNKNRQSIFLFNFSVMCCSASFFHFMLQENAPLLATELKHEKCSSCLHLRIWVVKRNTTKMTDHESGFSFTAKPPKKTSKQSQFTSKLFGNIRTQSVTFPPSFPAAPGRPCSPGGPGGPGCPLSPLGPVPPVGPYGQETNIIYLLWHANVEAEELTLEEWT